MMRHLHIAALLLALVACGAPAQSQHPTPAAGLSPATSVAALTAGTQPDAQTHLDVRGFRVDFAKATQTLRPLIAAMDVKATPAAESESVGRVRAGADECVHKPQHATRFTPILRALCRPSARTP